MSSQGPSNRSTSDVAAQRAETRKDEQFTAEVAHESPEGTPPAGTMHSGKLRLLLIALFVAALLAGVIVAWSVNLAVGVTIALLGGLLLIANPVVWAGFSRATEREHVEKQLDD